MEAQGHGNASVELVFFAIDGDDQTIRAVLRNGNLYMEDGTTVVGFINEDGSCGNRIGNTILMLPGWFTSEYKLTEISRFFELLLYREETFLGMIDEDCCVVDAVGKIIGHARLDRDEGVVRASNGALLGTISQSGLVRMVSGRGALQIYGYTHNSFRIVIAYIFFFDIGALIPRGGKFQETPLLSPAPALVPTHLLPGNFSFILDGELAGMSIPLSRQQVETIVNYHNIVLVCSFIDSHRAPTEDLFEGLVQHILVPWEDMSTPPNKVRVVEALTAAERVIQEDKRAVAFHCYAGMGRTGTALALFLVRFRGFAAQDAIRFVRSKRPGSIETLQQEQYIIEFAASLEK